MIFKTPRGRVKAKRIHDMEYPHHRPLTVFGYVIGCEDGHEYVCFDTDIPSVRYGNLHAKVTSHIRTYISDHDYDPERERLTPLWSMRPEHGGVTGHRVIRRPWWFRGRVYKLEEES